MPISFTFYAEHELFLSKWEGDISDSDLLQSYKQLFNRDKYKPGFHQITDIRNADMSGVTSKGLRQLSIMVEEHLSGKCEEFKTALTAPKDREFGFSRMYEMLSDESPEKVMVFRGIDDALKWLGIEEISIE
jgi:hypothetical protein